MPKGPQTEANRKVLKTMTAVVLLMVGLIIIAEVTDLLRHGAPPVKPLPSFNHAPTVPRF